jgi:Phage ABA sandwich domain
MTDDELDEAVARHIFDLNVATMPDGAPIVKPQYVRPPRYCSDVTASFLVVERMAEDGFDVNLSRRGGWVADFRRGRDDRFGVEFSPSLPLAICLAALKALGVEVPAAKAP